jgi:hypothetical protein
MNLIKQQSILIVVLFILTTSTGFLTGCTSDNTPNNIVATPLLSSVDSTILRNAYTDYEVLRQNVSAQEARQQLLDTLNNKTGVEKVELGVDNYTIFVTCSDGEFVAVDTFELDEEPSQGIGFSGLTYGKSSDDSYLRDHTLIFDGYPPESTGYSPRDYPGKIKYDVTAGSNDKTTCASKKVLVLGPCLWEFPTKPTDDCIEMFKEHGWADEDMTVKLITTVPWSEKFDCTKLVPDDFFDLEEYGIILFVGHGDAHVYKNYNDSNIYLQFCYFTAESFTLYPQLNKLKNDQKIIVIDEYKGGDENSSHVIYRTLIRADLLREKMSTLPSSYVYFASCYGGFFGQLFLEKGAKMVLGWNNMVLGNIADANMENLVGILLENGSSVYDAYADHAIIKSYSSADPHHPNRGLIPAYQGDEFYNFTYTYRPNVFFNIYPDPNVSEIPGLFYFPAWIDNLNITNIPDEATSVSVTLSYGADNSLKLDTYPVSSDTFKITNLNDVMFPANQTLSIQVKALDASKQELTDGQSTLTLSAGANSEQINLTEKKGTEESEYVEYNSYGTNVTINFTVSSNKWETGKEVTATATCTSSGYTKSVTGFRFFFHNCNVTIVAYNPPFRVNSSTGKIYGEIKNGTLAEIRWSSNSYSGIDSFGSPATFTIRFRLNSRNAGYVSSIQASYLGHEPSEMPTIVFR